MHVFTFLCFQTSYQKKPSGIFQWSALDLRNITPRKNEYLWPISESRLKGVFKLNYGEPLNKHMSKLKRYPNPLHITQFRNANDFLLHVVCELVNFWNCRCLKRTKKGLLQLWLLRTVKNVFQRITRTLCDFIYLLPKVV